MKRPRPNDIVVVDWVDIEHRPGGWEPIAGALADLPNRYRAVGVVLQSTALDIVLAPVIDRTEARVFCSYRIPWGVVQRWRRLR